MNKWELIIWPSNGSNNQRFKLEKKGDYYMIRCVADKRVIDVAGSELGGEVCLYSNAHGGPNQLWKLNKLDDFGMFEIESKLNKDYVLDVRGGKGNDGDTLLCYKRHGGMNQRWHLMANGDGTYTILSNTPRKLALDCKGGGK